MPRMLNTEQAAEILGVTPGRVRQWYLDGTLEPEPKEAGSRDRYVRADRVQRLKAARDKNPPRAGRPWPKPRQKSSAAAIAEPEVLAGRKPTKMVADARPRRERLVANG
jgi:hypothetical protein